MKNNSPAELYETLQNYPGTERAEVSRAALADWSYRQTYGKGLDPEKMEGLWQDLTAVMLNLENSTVLSADQIKGIRQRLSEARIQK